MKKKIKGFDMKKKNYEIRPRNSKFIDLREIHNNLPFIAIMDENGFVENKFGAPLLFRGTHLIDHTIRTLKKNYTGKLYVISVCLDNYASIWSSND